MNTLEIVVGAQYGSEAKGHVTQQLTQRHVERGESVQVVRVAGPNAGHSGHTPDGERVALRQVPVGALVDNPDIVLGIAAGSEIDPPVLLEEIDRLTNAGLFGDHNKILWVSAHATIISDEDKTIEAVSGLTDRLGSTAKGIGSARASRIMRSAKRLCDDQQLVDALIARGAIISYVSGPRAFGVDHTIIEGTQGYALGLHGEFYPQCTSSDCRAVDFAAMAGVNPWEYNSTKVWAVARIYPIRVAGNSGPLAMETSWDELGLRPELTTVTKKVRRVGQPDWNLVSRAVRANGGKPTVRLAITMLDQMFPQVRDQKFHPTKSPMPPDVLAYLEHIEWITNTEVQLACTGPNTATFRYQR